MPKSESHGHADAAEIRSMKATKDRGQSETFTAIFPTQNAADEKCDGSLGKTKFSK